MQKARFSLVVERDTDRRMGWAEALHGEGLSHVLRRTRPAEARGLLTRSTPLCVLVAGLSARGHRDGDMLDLLRDFRIAAPGAVILAVDHAARPETPAEAFAAGASDVLRGDHHPGEFLARLRIRLRDAGMGAPDGLRRDRLNLTPVEAQILACLEAHKGQIVTRDTLARATGDRDWTYGDRRFDVHVARIRKKLAAEYGGRVSLRTIRARGYMIERPDRG
ncbi:MAG: response regulator transcription factor [Pseudooceanicola sp.]